MIKRETFKQSWRQALVLLVLIACLALASSCSGLAEPKPIYDIPGADMDRGRQAMSEYGCIACHTIPGVTRADATVGPPLTGWAKRASIAGEFPNTPENLIAWIQDPQAMNPGSIIPDVGVPDTVARDISAYLYSLKWNPAEPPWRRNEKW